MAKIANSVGEVLARFQEFEKNHRYLSDGSASIPYEFSCYGKAPFVFCAPHASMLFARGRFKKRELATGALAQTLANAIGACSLKTCGYALSTDPLKTHALELAKEGRMLVDLHGMTSFHGCDICVGRGVAPSENTLELIDSLLRAGELLGLKIAVDKPFAGTSRHAAASDWPV